MPTKQHFGHYVNLKPSDTPEDAAEICGEANVTGVVKRARWDEMEWKDADGDVRYTAAPFNQILQAIPASCRLFLFVEWHTFKNAGGPPCPNYLDIRSTQKPDPDNPGSFKGYTCHLWELEVRQAFRNMIIDLAGRYNGNARVEGMILQETSTGLGTSPPTYDVDHYYTSLKSIYTTCSNRFSNSWCIPFMNYFPGDHSKMRTLMIDMQSLANKNVCLGGPDIMMSKPGLFNSHNSVYQVLLDYPGCRSNSAQFQSYGEHGPDLNYSVTGRTLCAPPPENRSCRLNEIWRFGVRGTRGDFDREAPYDAGLCINSFFFWNSPGRVIDGKTFDPDALNVIANHPYGADWRSRCSNDRWQP